jgi:transketolase
MRREFGKVIAELINEDKTTYLIVGDLGYGIFDQVKRENPSHIINFGVNEQAAIGVASGMALEGFKPYFFSITPFALERPFEQIKLDVVEQKANVKIIGFWNYPHSGPTHRTKNTKDICNILGIKYIAPQDSLETRNKIKEMHYINEPAFFYLTKHP